MPARPDARSARPLLAAAVAACLLAACGGRDDARNHDARTGVDDAALPTPQAGGGVTGSADVAAGGAAPTLGAGGPPTAPTDAQVATAFGPDGLPHEATDAAAADGAPVDAGDPALANPEAGTADGSAAPPLVPAAGTPEPTAADAVTVVRDYYAAINARNFGRAYALWSGSGRASGQTPEQFAGGYAQTQGVSASIGQPGAQDAGAGQRFVQVPVALRATQADGSIKRFAGSFTLHRAVADGATPEQRAWRIRNADLREVAE